MNLGICLHYVVILSTVFFYCSTTKDLGYTSCVLLDRVRLLQQNLCITTMTQTEYVHVYVCTKMCIHAIIDLCTFEVPKFSPYAFDSSMHTVINVPCRVLTLVPWERGNSSLTAFYKESKWWVNVHVCHSVISMGSQFPVVTFVLIFHPQFTCKCWSRMPALTAKWTFVCVP